MDRIENIKTNLLELKTETETLCKNIDVLLEEVEKVKTNEDIEKFCELSEELTEGFSHLEIF